MLFGLGLGRAGFGPRRRRRRRPPANAVVQHPAKHDEDQWGRIDREVRNLLPDVLRPPPVLVGPHEPVTVCFRARAGQKGRRERE